MKNKNGQTLVEAVVALGIAAIVITALLAVTTVSVNRSQYVKEQTLVRQYAQEGMEWLRAQRNSDWTTFSSHAGANPTWIIWCLNDLVWPGTQGTDIEPCPVGTYITGTSYTRYVRMKTSPPGGGGIYRIEIELTVAWQEGGRTHVSQQNTYLSRY